MFDIFRLYKLEVKSVMKKLLFSIIVIALISGFPSFSHSKGIKEYCALFIKRFRRDKKL